MTDPIADMLTRIRNGLAVRKEEVVLPMSKVKHNVAKILEQQKYIEKVEVIKRSAGKSQFNDLRIVLKYAKGVPSISHLKRVSKPGLRVYASREKLPRVLNNYGIAIMSTSQGVMTNKEAKRKGIGGEVLCEIY